ncbi:uncharacterized protein LOC131654060 [Vicia villosa]|uniref:uncharacterized protein LOC131654060 n=1 Tax=Vicia villosa TaxID=3911 RepID=UPI00273B5755|nr:uncharacterized protein LOC131654060 [Vicia villosa]
MAISVSEIVVLRSTFNNCNFSCFRRKVNVVTSPNTSLTSLLFPAITTTRLSSVVPRALDPKTGEQNSTTSSFQEDLVYVAKLLGGSFAGAAVIKYGSGVFPVITTPNLVLSLVIILTPVIVAVFLLINQSLRQKL